MDVSKIFKAHLYPAEPLTVTVMNPNIESKLFFQKRTSLQEDKNCVQFKVQLRMSPVI